MVRYEGADDNAEAEDCRCKCTDGRGRCPGGKRDGPAATWSSGGVVPLVKG